MGKDLQTVGQSPAELIALAVSADTDLEQLAGLLTLQERWEANEAKKAYHKAMAAFKANPPQIGKDKHVKYTKKDGSVTEYDHASLANATKEISKELSAHGLSASWRTSQNGKIVVACVLTHEMGHSEETSLSCDADSSGSKNAIQAIGSTISYLERYTLLAITGLATHDMDDDAQSATVTAEPITEDELLALNDWLASANRTEEQVCKVLKIESFKQLTKPLYAKAISALKKTAGQE